MDGVHKVKNLLDVAFVPSEVELHLACFIDNRDVEFEPSIIDSSIGLLDGLDLHKVNKLQFPVFLHELEQMFLRQRNDSE